MIFLNNSSAGAWSGRHITFSGSISRNGANRENGESDNFLLGKNYLDNTLLKNSYWMVYEPYLEELWFTSIEQSRLILYMWNSGQNFDWNSAHRIRSISKTRCKMDNDIICRPGFYLKPQSDSEFLTAVCFQRIQLSWSTGDGQWPILILHLALEMLLFLLYFCGRTDKILTGKFYI